MSPPTDFAPNEGSDVDIDSWLQPLAEWAAALTYADIPSPVIAEAKTAILDVVGVSFAGAATPAAGIARRRAFRDYRAGRCSVVGSAKRLVPPGAAFTNAVAAHALDFDDTSYAGIVHTSSIVFPAALAAVEDLSLSGRDVLTAFIAGAEIELRLGLLLTNEMYFTGWWSSGILGALGAASAAARAYGLDADGMKGALSLAAGAAAGLRVCIGTPAKPIYAGHSSETGIRAAQLIASESVEIPDHLSGSSGFVALFGGRRLATSANADIGETYALSSPGLVYKTYPVCSAAQAALQAVAEILGDGVCADDVIRVECEVSPLVAESLSYSSPQSVSQAQFSMPFAIGCLLTFGRLTVDLLSEEVLRDETLREAMKRVEVVTVSQMGEFDALEGASVSLACRDGKVIHARREKARGSLSDPLSPAELERKFEACAGRTLGDREISRRIQQISSLESLSECGDLLRVTPRSEVEQSITQTNGDGSRR